MKPFRCMYDARRWYDNNSYGRQCTVIVKKYTKVVEVTYPLVKITFLGEFLRFIESENAIPKS